MLCDFHGPPSELEFRFIGGLSIIKISLPPQLGGRDPSGEEVTAEMIRKQMTETEWQKIYEMSKDNHLYQNLISSLFPTIHGQ